jgi:hypothetical protein
MIRQEMHINPPERDISILWFTYLIPARATGVAGQGVSAHTAFSQRRSADKVPWTGFSNVLFASGSQQSLEFAPRSL